MAQAPKGLGPKARRIWREITHEYELRSDELRVLEDACREVDLVERMESELAGEETKLVVRGSMGQPVASPLVQEIRQHRALVQRLLASLKLTDAAGPAGAQAPTSTSAREAAMARWGRGA